MQDTKFVLMFQRKGDREVTYGRLLWLPCKPPGWGRVVVSPTGRFGQSWEEPAFLTSEAPSGTGLGCGPQNRVWDGAAWAGVALPTVQEYKYHPTGELFGELANQREWLLQGSTAYSLLPGVVSNVAGRRSVPGANMMCVPTGNTVGRPGCHTSGENTWRGSQTIQRDIMELRKARRQTGKREVGLP